MRRLVNTSASQSCKWQLTGMSYWYRGALMQPSTAHDSGQVDPRRSTTDISPPQSAALGLHPVARKLLLINRPLSYFLCNIRNL